MINTKSYVGFCRCQIRFWKVQSIGVDSEGAKHLFSLFEKRHFRPTQTIVRWYDYKTRIVFYKKYFITYFFY